MCFKSSRLRRMRRALEKCGKRHLNKGNTVVKLAHNLHQSPCIATSDFSLQMVCHVLHAVSRHLSPPFFRQASPLWSLTCQQGLRSPPWRGSLLCDSRASPSSLVSSLSALRVVDQPHFHTFSQPVNATILCRAVLVSVVVDQRDC